MNWILTSFNHCEHAAAFNSQRDTAPRFCFSPSGCHSRLPLPGPTVETPMPECVCLLVWARYLQVTEGFSLPETRNSPPKRGGEHAHRFRAERAAVGGTLWGCTRQCQVVSGARGCSFLPLGTRGPAGACEEPRGCPTRLNSYKLTGLL